MKNLRGECQQCGELIEFEADAVGTMTECPHCGQATELMLALPPETSSSGRTKAIVFTVVALVILLGGVGGTMLALKRAQRMSAQHQQTRGNAIPTPAKPAEPFVDIGFRASPVTLDKVEGSSLVYARGAIVNLTNRQRFSVRIELDVLDATSNKVGSATDYASTLEPSAEWRFRAQVLEKKAASARVATIKEDK